MTEEAPELDGFSDVVEVESDDFSITYHALQEAVGRTVAIKVFLPDASQGVSRRWERERAALGRLSAHPNILSVFDSGSLPDGRLYIIMDANAASLSSKIDTDGPVSVEEAAIWGVKLAGALETAHESGVLHRDLSPMNVVVSPFGEPMLTGFGIADVAGISAGRTRTISTSDWYVAPEVLSGSRTTSESDVYSLGSVLYTMVAGEAAHPRIRGRSMVEEIVRIQTAPVVPPSSVDIPPPIWQVIGKAMAIDPRDRYGTAADFGAALQNAGRELGYSMPALRLYSDDVPEDVDAELPRGSAQTQIVDRQQRQQLAAESEPTSSTSLASWLRHPALLAVVAFIVVGGALVAFLATNRSDDGSSTTTTAAGESTNTTVDEAPAASAPEPSGTDASYTIAAGGTLIITSQDAGPTASLRIQARPANGTLIALARDGSLQYLADGGFIGTDEFGYLACVDAKCTDHSVVVTVREPNRSELDLIAVVEAGGGSSSCRVTDPATFAQPDMLSPNATAICRIGGADVVIVKWDADVDTSTEMFDLFLYLDERSGTLTPESEDWSIDGEFQGGVVELTDPSSRPYVRWDVFGGPSIDRGTIAAWATFESSSEDGADESVRLREWWEAHNSILADIAKVQRDTVAFFNTATAEWRLLDSYAVEEVFTFGDANDRPILGDWDCDSIDTAGVLRPTTSTVYLRNSNSAGPADAQFSMGASGDIPIAGDFNGDGCDTVSLYRPSTQSFFIFDSLGQAGTPHLVHEFNFGDPGDQGLAGDWNGDGLDTVALFRQATGLFIWTNEPSSGVADGQIAFGDVGDVAIAGDWGGTDRMDTPAIHDSDTWTFVFKHSLTDDDTTTELFVFSEDAEIPLAGVFE